MRITPEDKQEELMELPVGNHVFGGVAAKSSACDSQEVDLTRKCVGKYGNSGKY